MSNVKFYDGEVEKIANDLTALFGYSAHGVRNPKATFPK